MCLSSLRFCKRLLLERHIVLELFSRESWKFSMTTSCFLYV